MSTRKTPAEFVCEGCGVTVFRAKPPARDNRTMFCSGLCKLRVFNQRHRAASKCERCGGQVLWWSSRMCRECSAAVQTEAAAARLVSAKCHVCSTEFTKKPSSLKVTCGSRRCARLISHGERTYHPNRPIEIICSLCGEKAIRGAKALFCRKCARVKANHYPYLAGLPRDEHALSAEERELLETTKVLRTLRQEAYASWNSSKS